MDKRHGPDNLVAMRLLLAVGVMVMHLNRSPVLRFPWVAAFIGLSGYLICGSMEHSRSYAHFAWKRILRVWPAFAASFVLVGLFGGVGALWPTLENWLAMGSKGGESWNQPLWSLSVEEVLYGMLAAWFAARILPSRWPATVFLVSIAVICSWATNAHHDVAQTALTNAFVHSCVLYIWRDRILWSTRLALVCLAVAILCEHVSNSATGLIQLPLLVYSLLTLSLHSKPVLDGVKRMGDLSFGIYCYHWPIMLALWGFGVNGYGLAIATSVSTVLFAFLSWRFIEAPALELKDVRWLTVRPRRTQRVEPVVAGDVVPGAGLEPAQGCP